MPPRSRPAWHDAFDAQMGLWRWYRTDDGLAWLRGLLDESLRNAGNEPFAKTLAGLYDAESGRLIQCDPFYVSDDMCEVIDYARETFEPEALHEYDLLSPRGFLYYARPVFILDRIGNEMPIRGFSWTQQYSTTAEDSEGHARIVAELERRGNEGQAEHGDRWVYSEMDAMVEAGMLERHGVAITLYSDTRPYCEISSRRFHGETEEEYERSLANIVARTAGTPILPVHLAPWNYGMTFDGNEIDVLGKQTGADQWWKLLQSTLRLMLQKRPRAGFGRPDRPARRDWERHGGRPDTEVVIVRLRREEAPRSNEPPSTNGRHLTHRHIRTGHWRNQWYPSQQVHRQIFIDPTVVGDESLPLIVRPRRVFQWTK